LEERAKRGEWERERRGEWESGRKDRISNLV